MVLGSARGFAGGGIDPVALAMCAANRSGAVVVAPAGNDGATGTSSGSVGTPAFAPGVLTVGGIAGGTGPPTADVSASMRPAAATFSDLPLLAADSGQAAQAGAPLVPASGEVGVGTVIDVRDFAGADGRGTIAGAMAMVIRSGVHISGIARRAAPRL